MPLSQGIPQCGASRASSQAAPLPEPPAADTSFVGKRDLWLRQAMQPSDEEQYSPKCMQLGTALAAITLQHSANHTEAWRLDMSCSCCAAWVYDIAGLSWPRSSQLLRHLSHRQDAHPPLWPICRTCFLLNIPQVLTSNLTSPAAKALTWKSACTRVSRRPSTSLMALALRALYSDSFSPLRLGSASLDSSWASAMMVQPLPPNQDHRDSFCHLCMGGRYVGLRGG